MSELIIFVLMGILIGCGLWVGLRFETFLARFLLNWRLKRADIKVKSIKQRYPLGTMIIRDGVVYRYVRMK